MKKLVKTYHVLIYILFNFKSKNLKYRAFLRVRIIKNTELEKRPNLKKNMLFCIYFIEIFLIYSNILDIFSFTY